MIHPIENTADPSGPETIRYSSGGSWVLKLTHYPLSLHNISYRKCQNRSSLYGWLRLLSSLRYPLHRLAVLPAREIKLKRALQVHPEIGGHAKVPAET